MSTALVLAPLPDGRRAVTLKAMHAGDGDEAEALLAPVHAAGGAPIGGGLRTMAYADAAMGGTPARHLSLHAELPDALLDAVAAAGEEATVELRHWGGAMGSPAPDAGPVGHRHLPFSVIADAPHPALAPLAGRATFLNFCSDTTRTSDAYTSLDLHRLRAVKATYDPDGVFSYNHSIG